MEGEFISLCGKGKLDEAKALYRFFENVDVSYNNEQAFRLTCYYGHLEVAKWLLQVKPDINISAQDDYAFRWACIYGHLEVAKWLLSVKPDINISIDNEYTFRWVCYNGYLEVAKWLQSLKPYLYVIIYDINGNYTGYKIRTKEEANMEKRKIALHLALQDTTNILYHLPVDIAKAVTLFV